MKIIKNQHAENGLKVLVETLKNKKIITDDDLNKVHKQLKAKRKLREKKLKKLKEVKKKNDHKKKNKKR